VRYDGADGVMTPWYGAGQRRIVSRNDAFILRDAYGYTVVDPATAQIGLDGNTFYATLDRSSGKLTIRGRQDVASSDVITVDSTTTSLGVPVVNVTVRLGTPVPGTADPGAYTSTFPAGFISSIEIDTGAGS